MITIIVDTKDEYEKMMKYAQQYVCIHMPFTLCGIYPTNSCDKCYKDNHVFAGIRVISPVDNAPPNHI